MAFLDLAGLSRFLNNIKTIFVPTSEKGTANGVATLDSSGKVPAAQLDLASKADKTDTVLNTTLSMGRKANTTVGANSTALGDMVEASGAQSFATGGGTKASGPQSHAEGAATVASGSFSHAEGANTTASGFYSHTEGAGTVASHTYTHAEGNTTTASGENSHAEGNLTIASGAKSHAEGLGGTFTSGSTTYTSQAAGTADHTEGYKCVTVSSNTPGSHAEGYQTISSGGASHSEGGGTKASGMNSHAEGGGTKASGSNSHAEGGGTTASGDYSHAEGSGSNASNTYSHAEGCASTASGLGAHAEGYTTVASNDYSHSEGFTTTASGAQSHSEGKNTKAVGEDSHAEGFGGTFTVDGVTYTSQAAGMCDHTEGYVCVTVTGQPGNHAEGYQTRATGGASHSEGSSTVASGGQSHAEGGGSISSGYASHAEGYNTVASGAESHSEGGATTASGGMSHAEGNGTTASNAQSHAEGYNTTSSGFQSHAEGNYTTASGSQAHSEGYSTIASGHKSHAEGDNTKAVGSISHVSGSYNIADNYDNWPEWTANTSYSIGDKIKRTTVSSGVTTVNGYKCKTANSDSSFNLSKWNDLNGQMNYAEIIGNGTSDANRSNARILDWDGNERLKGDVYVGCNADSTGGTKLAKITDLPDISGKINTSEKGAANGVAELDSNGKVPSSQLPSYVDDVLEYASISSFPATGESGKIYIALDTNKTYRWGGSEYVSIASDLALGETSSTAYRGDRGKAAYDHATDANKLTTAQTSGLYKIATTAEGHIASATAVVKADITALGIPAQDTTYSDMTGATGSAAGTHGLVPAPAAGDETKYLRGDGTWAASTVQIPYATDIPMSTTDSTRVDVAIGAKLDENQGAGNAGKFMKVGNDGSLVPDTVPDPTGKADKVSGATSGNFAGLDSNGNLTDSGKKASDFMEEMTILSYGNSTWNDFITAYNGNRVVYCRASSGSNPASGSQTRLAFMAYVNNADSPTEVEFQYYRSISSHSASQQGDQVFVYKLTSAGAWTVTTREAMSKIVAGTNMSSSYSDGVLTLTATDTTYSDMTGASSSAAGTAGLVPAPSAGDEDKVLKGDGTWGDVDALPAVTSSDNDKVLQVVNGEWNVGNEKIEKHYDAEYHFIPSIMYGLPADYVSRYIWTDGENIYYSLSNDQYVLDKSTSTWSVKSWTGLTSFRGDYIWTDGDNIYYSDYSTQYVLNKSTSTWSTKSWTGLTSFNGNSVWTDGENIYYSNYSTQYVLNKSTSTWSTKTWTGFTYFSGEYVWSDGDNIYYSSSSTQYVLNKSTSTWSTKTWTGLTSFSGDSVWTDGDNIYYSYNSNQYVLNKSTSTWSTKTWIGLTNLNGYYVWSDGDDIYYSYNSNQYVFNKSTSTWSVKSWTGLTSFIGDSVWTDGDNIYYSFDSNQYVLDKSTSTWNVKTWTGLASFSGDYIWFDGDNIYYSSGSTQYVLNKLTSAWSTKTWIGLTNFDGNRIWTDGENIYYSDYSKQYVLNKSTSIWNVKTWNGLTSFDGSYVWTDGDNIYYSNSSTQYVLNKSTSTWSTKTWTGLTSFNGRYIWSDGDNIYQNNWKYVSGDKLLLGQNGTFNPVSIDEVLPSDFTGASASATGSHGLVPAPSAGDEDKFLRGDGTWDDVPNPQVMTGATSSAAGASGLVPAPSAGDNSKFLRGDGTWSEASSGTVLSDISFSFSTGDWTAISGVFKAEVTNSVFVSGSKEIVNYTDSMQNLRSGITVEKDDINNKMVFTVSVLPTGIISGNILSFGNGAVYTVQLPSVSSADNGKVMRVVNGEWAVASLATANGVSF